MIELAAVIGILISVPVVLVYPFEHVERANFKCVAASVQLRWFNAALEVYHADCGRYPSPQEGLRALVVDTKAPCWQGPYLQRAVPLDPWRRSYFYDASPNPPAVISWGADGKPGGSSLDADISSRDPTYRVPENVSRLKVLSIWIGAILTLAMSVFVLARHKVQGD